MKIMFASELSRRLSGRGVDVHSAQPGLSKTPLFGKMDFSQGSLFHRLQSVIMAAGAAIIGQSPERGAISAAYCAAAPQLTGQTGLYVGPYYFLDISLNFPNTMRVKPSSKVARDPAACAR